MIHQVIPVGPLQCNCSIIGDSESKEALVVDPGADISDILGILHRHGLELKHIFITHGHIDHIGGAMKLKQATGAPIYMNQADQQQVKLLDMQAAWIGMESPGPVVVDQEARDQDVIRTGSLMATVLHTPGHTEGSTSLYFPEQKKILAGDTLFAGSIGRTDLPGGNFDKIMRSLHGAYMQLPDDVEVTPGHGPQTTIGMERETNPFLTDDRFRPRIQQ